MKNLPRTMKAVQLIAHGGVEQLKFCQNVVVPTPKENEVLIRVFAAGVNNTDVNTRTAWYSKNNNVEDASWSGNKVEFPRIQGADVCGEIVAVGSLVNANRIGERVLVEPCIKDVNGEVVDPFWYLGSECDGGFAEFCVVSNKHAYRVDSVLTDVELASFPCSYSTAENMLSRSFVSKDEWVLVTGASGGVGSAVVQLAKARGAKVVAVTSESKVEQVKELGADKVVVKGVNLVEVLGVNSVDVVVDVVAGPNWTQCVEVLKPQGRYAVAGAIDGAVVEFDVRNLYLKDLSFFGCTVLEPEVFSNVIRHIELGNVKPLVAKTFTLEQVREAQEVFVQKDFVGKIVIDVVA